MKQFQTWFDVRLWGYFIHWFNEIYALANKKGKKATTNPFSIPQICCYCGKRLWHWTLHSEVIERDKKKIILHSESFLMVWCNTQPVIAIHFAIWCPFIIIIITLLLHHICQCSVFNTAIYLQYVFFVVVASIHRFIIFNIGYRLKSKCGWFCNRNRSLANMKDNMCSTRTTIASLGVVVVVALTIAVLLVVVAVGVQADAGSGGDGGGGVRLLFITNFYIAGICWVACNFMMDSRLL